MPSQGVSLSRIHDTGHAAVRASLGALVLSVAALVLWVVGGDRGTAVYDHGTTSAPAVDGGGARDEQMPRPVDTNTLADVDLSPIGEALQAADVERAVELYSTSFLHDPSHVSAAHRDALLEHASDLIQSRRYDSATALLDAYLAVFFRDTEAWIYAGRAYREKREYRPAIEAFLMATQDHQHPDLRRLVDGQLSMTVHRYVQELREQAKHTEVADLYSYLTQANPRNPHYFVALARAYLALGQESDALAALYHVAAEDPVADEVRALIEAIDTDR